MKLDNVTLRDLPEGTLVWMTFGAGTAHLLLRRVGKDLTAREWFNHGRPGSTAPSPSADLFGVADGARFEVVSRDEADRRIAIHALSPELFLEVVGGQP